MVCELCLKHDLTFDLLCVLISTSSPLIMDLTESRRAGEFLIVGSYQPRLIAPCSRRHSARLSHGLFLLYCCIESQTEYSCLLPEEVFVGIRTHLAVVLDSCRIYVGFETGFFQMNLSSLVLLHKKRLQDFYWFIGVALSCKPSRCSAL